MFYEGAAYKQYGPKEISTLSTQDPILGKAIERIGVLEWNIKSDTFAVLIESIIAQQISKKAAQTVQAKLYNLTKMDAAAIHGLSQDDVKACGMSARKASYIKGVAEASITNAVDFASLHTLTDAEVIKTLSSLKGVGVWTAEMMLIFSLGRPDVISYLDLAIRRGMMNLYNLQELPRQEFLKISKNYSPHSSIASLYLWELSKD